MQTMPKPINANEMTNKTPKQLVKSYFVCMENNVMPKQTKTVIPTAFKTESVV